MWMKGSTYIDEMLVVYECIWCRCRECAVSFCFSRRWTRWLIVLENEDVSASSPKDSGADYALYTRFSGEQAGWLSVVSARDVVVLHFLTMVGE